QQLPPGECPPNDLPEERSLVLLGGERRPRLALPATALQGEELGDPALDVAVRGERLHFQLAVLAQPPLQAAILLELLPGQRVLQVLLRRERGVQEGPLVEESVQRPLPPFGSPADALVDGAVGSD